MTSFNQNDTTNVNYNNLILPHDSSDIKILLSLIVCLLIFILYVFSVPISQIIFFFSDDAYYYFKVAQNIVAGAGSTFDGYNLTNGYHPFWMLIVLPVFGLTQSDSELSLRIILMIQGVLAFLSFWLCWLYVIKLLNRFAGIIALLLLFIFASPILLLFNGLESGLLIFWVFLLLTLDQKYRLLDDKASVTKRISLGIMLGIFILIRLDSIFYIIALAIFKIIWFKSNNGTIKKIGSLITFYWLSAFICLFLLLPYFMWNFG